MGTVAETVAHLGRSMQWDFRLLVVLNVVLCLLLVVVIVARRR